MTREKKRILSILGCVAGVIILIVAIVTSDEFKELFEEKTTHGEIHISDLQYRAIYNYSDYEQGVEAEEAKGRWQKAISKKYGLNYVVSGDVAYGEQTIVYGMIRETSIKEINLKPVEEEVFYPFVILMDENENALWEYSENNGAYYVYIDYVIVQNDVITMFSWRDSKNNKDINKTYITRISNTGQQLSCVESDMYGRVRMVLGVENYYYAYVDKEIHNNGIFRISQDGKGEEVFFCANEDEMERYTILDMAVINGKLYFSGYSRKLELFKAEQDELHDDFFQYHIDTETRQNADGEYYTYLSEKKLERLRDIYDAVLFSYDLSTGECDLIKKIDDRLGTFVEINDDNQVEWDLENIYVAVNNGSFNVAMGTKVEKEYFDENGESVGKEVVNEIRINARNYGEE